MENEQKMEMDIKPVRQRKLNESQKRILTLLYVFRFGTRQQFMDSYGSPISQQAMDIKLRSLCRRGYIGRRYDSSFKIIGRPASYYLLAKGINVLKQEPERYNDAALRKLIQDRRRSNAFIEHWIGVFDVFLRCKHRYGDNLRFLGQNSLLKRDAFPHPLPDGYMFLQSDENRHCFVDSFDSTTPFYKVKKRILYYADFAENNELPTTRVFPTIVFICDTARLKQKVQTVASRRFGSSWKEISYTVLRRDELGSAHIFPT